MTIIDIETAMHMLYDNVPKTPYNPARWTTAKKFVPDFDVVKNSFVPDPVLKDPKIFVRDTTLDK